MSSSVTDRIVYKLSACDYKFYAEKTKMDRRGISWRIIKRQNRYFSCVWITINRTKQGHSKAYIADLQYSDQCSYNKPLVRKYGTECMIKGALRFILEQYPDVQQVDFADKSRRACAEIGTDIYLASHNLMIYGKTWYERVYGAVPVGRTLRVRDAILTKLKEPISMDFDMFQDIILSRVDLTDDQGREVMTLFTNAKSWGDLFKGMYHRFGCGMFESIPRNFYHHFDLQDIAGTIWTIPRQVIDAYDVNLTHEQDISVKGGSLFRDLPNPWA
jgi:hypothetical protein